MYRKVLKHSVIRTSVDAMPYKVIKTVYFICSRCKYEWIPRDSGKRPVTCPKCRSPYWDRPRTRIHAKKISKKELGSE